MNHQRRRPSRAMMTATIVRAAQQRASQSRLCFRLNAVGRPSSEDVIAHFLYGTDRSVSCPGRCTWRSGDQTSSTDPTPEALSCRGSRGRGPASNRRQGPHLQDGPSESGNADRRVDTSTWAPTDRSALSRKRMPVTNTRPPAVLRDDRSKCGSESAELRTSRLSGAGLRFDR
jgi:hypothetical protein